MVLWRLQRLDELVHLDVAVGVAIGHRMVVIRACMGTAATDGNATVVEWRLADAVAYLVFKLGALGSQPLIA